MAKKRAKAKDEARPKELGRSGGPSETLRIAVTFKRPSDQLGLTSFGTRMTPRWPAPSSPTP